MSWRSHRLLVRSSEFPTFAVIGGVMTLHDPFRNAPECSESSVHSSRAGTLSRRSADESDPVVRRILRFLVHKIRRYSKFMNSSSVLYQAIVGSVVPRFKIKLLNLLNKVI